MKTKLLLLLFLANFSIYAQTNLVSNGNLETWAAGVPQNWTISNSVTQSLNSSGGTYSAQLSYTTVSPKIIASVPLKAGATYTIKYKYKYVNSNYSGDHPISLKISAAGSSSSISSSIFATNNLWTEKETTFTPDSDLSYDLSISTFSFDSQAFDILIDDVAVYDDNEALQYTAIPDINFENKLISLGIDSGTPDGQVLTSKVASLTVLDVSSNSITDLTGIEAFVALKSLSCSTNRLTQLNVSKNIALTELNCSNNLLTALDLSGNTLLTSISCDYNKLTALSFSNNLALTNIVCANNQLTSIDVSKQLALETLNCGYNKIDALDVTSNVNLWKIICNDNWLKSLDLSKNNKLTFMFAHSNSLSSLNIQNGTNYLFNPNTSVASFYQNPYLTCIQVDNIAEANTRWVNRKDALADFSTDCAAFTSIPDVNFEKKLIALGIDRDGLNGKVQTSRIASVKVLNITSSSIADITGIQDFEALTTLYCYDNQITTLDISKNINLTTLSCGQNKLTSLDVSKNLALQELSFSSNQLTTIDVSKNLALTSLAFFSNNLTSLDISHNLALNVLQSQSNQLTTIDVSKNSALTVLGVSTNKLTNLDVSANLNLTSLACDQNLLTSLDVSKNTLLKTLNCSNNELKCILVADVDFAYTYWSNTKDKSAFYTKDCDAVTLIPDLNFENKLISLGIDTGAPDGKVLTGSIANVTFLNVSKSNISDLTGIQDFISLNYLNCGQNSLTALDVSENAVLDALFCNNNQIGVLDISKNTALTFLSCNNNQIKALDVSKNTALTVLGCNNNQIATIDVSNNLALTDLICYANKLTSLDVKKNTALTKLDSGSNQYTSLDVSANTALTFLGCNTSQLTSIDVSKNTALTLLDCRENKITNLDVSKLTALTELYCQSNQLKDLDVSKNKSLELINCSKNQLTTLDLSTHPATIGLYANSNQLTSLNLKNGNNANFQLLYLNLTNNPNLSCIQVDDKVYSDANWSAKKDATANYDTNCSGYYTEIPDSNFEQKLVDLGIDTDGLNGKITTANITSITSLDLSNGNIKNLTGIENFTALNILDCRNNQLTTLDLSKNSNLQILYATGNPLVYLNLKNGNNQNLIIQPETAKNAAGITGTTFIGLTSLSCVKVDDAAYSNTNWSKIKETTTTYSETCTLGIEDSVFDKVALYPNPTKGELNIQNVQLEKATVYNSLGQLVKTFTLDSSNVNNTINLAGLPKGIYYVYLINQDFASAKKVIVE